MIISLLVDALMYINYILGAVLLTWIIFKDGDIIDKIVIGLITFVFGAYGYVLYETEYI